jgi:hypothetical protein
MALTVAGQFVFEFEAPYLIAVAGSLGVYVLVGTAEAARPRGTTTR